jgi:hypothetical protein
MLPLEPISIVNISTKIVGEIFLLGVSVVDLVMVRHTNGECKVSQKDFFSVIAVLLRDMRFNLARPIIVVFGNMTLILLGVNVKVRLPFVLLLLGKMRVPNGDSLIPVVVVTILNVHPRQQWRPKPVKMTVVVGEISYLYPHVDTIN